MRLRPARATVAALTAVALACAGAPGPAAADITQSRFAVQLTTGAPSGFHTVDAVSYTHLTLPTICSV